MQACIFALLALAIGVQVNAQIYQGNVGVSSCPAYALYGTQTTAGAVTTWNVGSTTVKYCSYCVQAQVTGTLATTTLATKAVVTTNYLGNGYFCAQSCSFTAGSISFSSGSATLTQSGISLAPLAYYYAVTTLTLPSASTTTTFTGTYYLTSVNCFTAAACKFSTSPVLLLALVAAVFLFRKN